MSQTPESPTLPPPPPPTTAIPIPASSDSNSRALFVYPENGEAGSLITANFHPELASADFSIAPDGSFVETSSGAAAMELKKRYDIHLGVNASIRSPYVITAFVNQHGRRMFRIGHRDMSAPPAAAGQSAELQFINRAPSSSQHHHTSSIPYSSTNSRRQSRFSGLFRPQQSQNGRHLYYSQKNKNKLRKPRSNPDFQQPQPQTTSPTRPTAGLPHLSSTLPMKKSAGGRTHSLSVTALDQHPVNSIPSAFIVGPYAYASTSKTTSAASSPPLGYDSLSPPRNNHHSSSQSLVNAKKSDIFGEVMNWSSSPAAGIARNRDRNNSTASSMSMAMSGASYTSPSSLSSVSSSVSSHSSFGVGEFGEVSGHRGGSVSASQTGYFSPPHPSQSTSQTRIISRPFGSNVIFEPRWRPKSKHQRGRKSVSSKMVPPIPPLPANSHHQHSNSVSTSMTSSSDASTLGTPNPNRIEERRRKSQSWSGVGADADDNYPGESSREIIATGYVSEAEAVDGEEEGREEFELWSAYFDNHIGSPQGPTSLSSFTTRLNGGDTQKVPEVHMEGESKGKEPQPLGEEEEESDFSIFLRVGSSKLRAKPSLDSVMTARQSGPRRSSGNLRNRRRRVGKVDEGEEADGEDFDDDDLDPDEDDLDTTETPPRPPSAIRMRPPDSVPLVDTKDADDKSSASTRTSSLSSEESSDVVVIPTLDDHEDALIPKTPTPPDLLTPSTSRPETASTTPQQRPEVPVQPLPSTAMHTRFSTDVFEVLQTYRGLPLLDRLEKRQKRTINGNEDMDDDEDEDDDGEDEWVIRLSLQDDESAAPRNDPRFVIWGEVADAPAEDDNSTASVSLSQVGAVGTASRTSSISVGGSEGQSTGGRSRGGSLSKKKAKKELKKKEKEARSRSGSGTAGVGGEGIPLPSATPNPSGSTFKTLSRSDLSEPTPVAQTHTIPPTQLEDSTDGKMRQILAATIERWLAQVTSEYNYDELLVFFLTYRTYISPLDLAHLFICRFHWAVSDEPGPVDPGANPAAGNPGPEDRVKRIVRLRTFVALRYWLTTFFVPDFLNNRELRVLIASWLNSLVKDPILGRYPDALSIVKKLRKVAKECKRAFAPPSPKRTKGRLSEREVTSPSSASSSLPTPEESDGSGKEHLLGERFAEAARELKKQKALEEQAEDSDVDLDFLPDSTNVGIFSLGNTGLPLSSLSILQRTDPAPNSTSSDADILMETSQTLPMHNNLLSKMMGRLGRWKRVLNNNRPVSRIVTYGGYGGEGFGMAAVGMGMMDLKTYGLETSGQGEMIARSGEARAPNNHLPSSPPSLPHASLSPHPLATSPSISTLRNAEGAALEPRELNANLEPAISEPSPTPSAETPQASTRLSVVTTPASIMQDAADAASLSSRSSALSISRTSSTDSLGVPLSATRSSAMFPTFRSPWQFDVISIDQLSDTSSNEEEPPLPPGLDQTLQQNRLQRRLPTRRVMEVENADRGTVSSMGIVSRDSYASTASASSSVGPDENDQGLGRGIHQWQLNNLVDSLTDNEEDGDVENALKRLEGHINPDRQQEKAYKVEGWVRTIREKLLAGDYDQDERPRWMDEEVEELEDNDNASELHVNGDVSNSDVPSIHGPEEAEHVDDEGIEVNTTPIVGPTSPPRATSDAKPTLEDVVPLEILQSRVSDVPSATPHRPSISSKSNLPPLHHSFILDSKADILAQYFALIDKELFCSLNFDELLSSSWMHCEEIEVLDWKQFMNDCARWRVESRWPERTCTLGNIRARFNLLANFSASEVVHTHPNDRVTVFVKLLHVAWRSYHRNSLNTVVAIITGLQSRIVTQAMRRSMGRLSSWDARIFRDLKLFIASTNSFQYLREAIERILDPKSMDPSGHHGSVIVNGVPAEQAPRGRGARPAVSSGCIPFIGVYLSQLYQHHQLPDLIDPTAPNEAVGLDPVTSNLDSPAHPEVFDALAPLPSSLHLEPLINVQKQRLIAGVVKSCIAGQQLATRMRFPTADSPLYKKCLDLKASDSETLHHVLVSLPG